MQSKERYRFPRGPVLISNGRAIWIADAQRDDGKPFIVRMDEMLTAFIELEIAAYPHSDAM